MDKLWTAGVLSKKLRRRKNTISDKIHETRGDTVVIPNSQGSPKECPPRYVGVLMMWKYLEDGSLNVYSSPYIKAYHSATGVYVVDGKE